MTATVARQYPELERFPGPRANAAGIKSLENWGSTEVALVGPYGRKVPLVNGFERQCLIDCEKREFQAG
jgi:hypothetical protein